MWLAVSGLGGALLGKMKHDQAVANEKADRARAAATERYSPWTGMRAAPIQRAGSEFGDIFGGGVGGAMTGASLASAFGGMGGSPLPAGPAMAGGGAMGAQEAAQFGNQNPWAAVQKTRFA